MKVSKVRQEAARWFAHMQNVAEDDFREHARFERWLGADPSHAPAYRQMAGIWGDFESGDRLARLSHAVEQGQSAQRQIRRGVLRTGTLATVALLAGGTLGWQMLAPMRQRAWPSVELANASGQPAQVHILPDGSRLTLGAATRVQVRYEADRRLVLLHAGVAAFEVQADPERPFVVDSRQARVTVLGTRFAVDRFSDTHVRVSVDHGRVRVAQMRASLGGYWWREVQHWLLHDGQVLDVTESGGLRPATPAADAFAWQQGALVFSGATLGEMAVQLSRYTAKPVQAPQGDSRNGHTPRIVAVVQTRDIDRFLSHLPQLATLEVRHTPAATLLLPR